MLKRKNKKPLLTKEEIIELTNKKLIDNMSYIVDTCNVELKYTDGLLPIYDKDIDSKVNDYYRAIKNEISAYVSSADAYQEYSNNPFTKRDKLFVDRVNDNSDDIQKLITQNNYFSLIKKEISDYNIGEGAYKPTKSKPSVDPQKVRDEILWDNMRTFVDRVEAIISSDVDDFVNSKNKLSELGDSFNLEKEIKAIKESIDKKNKN